MATRSGLASISTRNRPAYQTATRRSGGVTFNYPGFGRDPEAAGAVPVANAPSAPTTTAPQAVSPASTIRPESDEDIDRRAADFGGANGAPSTENNVVSPDQSLTGVIGSIANAASALNPFGAFTALALSDLMGMPPTLSLTQVARGALGESLAEPTPENVSTEDDGTSGGAKADTTSNVTPDNPLTAETAPDAVAADEGGTGPDGGSKSDTAGTGNFGPDGSGGDAEGGTGPDGGDKGDTAGTGNSGPDGSGSDPGGDNAGTDSGGGGYGASDSSADGGYGGESQFMKGGYTGAGDDGIVQPDRPAGTVHEGEIVIPHHMVQQGHGLDALSKIRAGGAGQASARGGLPGVNTNGMMMDPVTSAGPNEVAPFHTPMGGRGAPQSAPAPMSNMQAENTMDDAFGGSFGNEGMGAAGSLADYDPDGMGMDGAPPPGDAEVASMTSVAQQDEYAFGAGMGGGGNVDGDSYLGEDHPYASVQRGSDPFTPADESQGVNADAAAMRLASLPPVAQQAMMMAIGSDPMVASALLEVLGPQFQKMISGALKASVPPQMGAAGAMGGMGAAPPPGMMG
ncbi:hypothetical protein [Falsiroseomonas tokyonensis]|uniref:Uncharacterized protein n=1 Tax=Falsiroseomonas tokyonensis TaxID=430521 RepID=A0ABV7C1I8_9PROT|nr:hypothetical protein [Falsiroseomonas tokyonensis]MBU8540176.1 hypothetical protein [Falsiroseomonas tokyonensis]